MKIYVLGNPLLEKDSTALRVANLLAGKFPEIEFREFDPMEDFDEEEVYLMDVVKGVRKVRVVEDFNLIHTRKIFSLHDYDLSYEIKLLKKLGKVKKVFLIAIPYGKKEREVCKEVEAQLHLILKKWLAQLKQGS